MTEFAHYPGTAPCPKCHETMLPQMPAGGWAPEGFEPMYDHYWCEPCDEYYDFEEVSPPCVTTKS